MIEKYLIVGDFQIPYHDPKAVEVMLRIAEDLKPDGLVLNGDFCDWRTMSDHFPARDEPGDRLINSLKHEVQIQRDMLNAIMARVKPTKTWWNDGNHEWRLFRALFKLPSVVQILGLPGMSDTLSIRGIFNLDKFGIKHSGEYPNGFWLKGGKAPLTDVWIEHGFMTGGKAGAVANKLLDARGVSVITGHTEKLGVVWKRAINRKFFGVEGGNLSILGEAAGKGIYSTVPHTAPELMNHQQGFLVLYGDEGKWWPVPVPIYDGKAMFNGKVYQA